MTKRRGMKQRTKKKVTAAIVLILAVLAYLGIDPMGILPPKDDSTSSQAVAGAPMEMAVLDVGQADSIFLTMPNGKTLLVDAGLNNTYDTIKGYIDRKGVKRIDAVVVTHPHADHMGCTDEIIRDYEIGDVYMTKAPSTTRGYENILNAVKQKGLKIKTLKAGVTIPLDDMVSIQVLAPVDDDFSDLNESSAVIRLTYGDTSFLLTGDAGKVSEKKMLNAGEPLRADVLKVGHHGSRESSTDAFLDAVKPKVAIISTGEGNEYGHPHKELLQRLNARGIEIYRTDQEGTVVVTSDGKHIQVTSEH